MIGEILNKRKSRNGLRPHLERRQSRLTRIFRAAMRIRGAKKGNTIIYI